MLSDAETQSGIVPISYRYENEDGCRFLVLNINTRADNDNILKHYSRSRQYAEQIKWLSGKKLPAYAYGNPALYMQCKRDNNALAVGLWNFFADATREIVVELDKEYTEIKFANCTGRLAKDKVYIDDIPAFGYAFFETFHG